MANIIELLQLPFMQRALIAGSVLAILTGIVGVITLIRKASFYGDAIAHSSLAGIALGLYFGIYPLSIALVYAIIIALLLPSIRKQFTLNLDNALAIILPISMGLGVLIFSQLPGYQPEMMSFLFGSILTIRLTEVFFIITVAGLSAVLFFFFLPKMLYLSLDEEYAKLLGLNTLLLQRIYEILLALIIIAGVKLLGIILVNALLIIPASTAKALSPSLKSWLILSPILSLLTIWGGILMSLITNTPPGATIAVFAGVIFAIAQMGKLFYVKTKS